MPKTFAQATFAPVGAEWYHNMGFGVFHSVVTGDTTINGIACRNIAVRPLIKNPEQAPGNISRYNFYVYDNTDTVFIYNDLFGKFTPLYVFNVQAGDTLHLPVLPLYECKGMMETDSQFVIVIDSVKLKNWDNIPLKTVYAHPVERAGVNYDYAYFSYGTLGYVQSLGSIQTGFLPECLNCASLLSESCQSVGTFRCYHEAADSGLSIALVDTCDGNIKTGISAVDVAKYLKVYPNPVHGWLNISFAQVPSPVVAFEVFDVLGRKVFAGKIFPATNASSLQINVTAWSAGVYLFKLKTANGAIASRKFVKK